MRLREINRLTILTIKGRKRATALLLVVLILVSMFISAAMISLDTIDAAESAMRAEQYGRWQVMLYAVKPDELDVLSSLGDCFASAEFVSDESDIGLVAAAEDRWLDYGSVKLSEGRYAEDAGEITLTRSQATENYSIGDTITVKHSFYNLVRSEAEHGTDPVTADRYLEIPGRAPECEKWWNANRDYYSGWGRDYEYDFAELDDAARKRVATYWYLGFGEDYLATLPSIAYDRELVPYNGKLAVINSSTSQTRLNGSWFGDNIGKVLSYEKNYDNIEVYVDYTVCGFVEPYADAWDRDMFDMPSAFVSASEAEDMRRAVETACEATGAVRAPERYVVALGYSPEMSADKLYDEVGDAYSQLRQGVYGMHFGLSNGFIQGYIYGVDAETGELRCRSMSGRGSYANVTLNSAQLGDLYRMDDLRTGKVHIDGLLPVVQDMTASGAYINQAGRDLRLNTYTYPDGGSNYAALQKFLLVSIFVIALCTLLIAFMTQMSYRMRRTCASPLRTAL